MVNVRYLYHANINFDCSFLVMFTIAPIAAIIVKMPSSVEKAS